MKYILIGFGGTGNAIVNSVYGRVPQSMKNNYEAFAIDTDKSDLSKLKHIRDRNKIVTSQEKLVNDLVGAVDKETGTPINYPFINTHRDVMQTQIATGAGQFRQISRLGYETMKGDLSQLVRTLDDVLLEVSRDKTQEVKIFYVGSICGGTGSGCMMQIAYYLRNRSHGAVHSTACLMLPSLFTESDDVALSNDEKLRIQANAYAFIKEWNTYNTIFHGDYPDDAKSNFDILQLRLGSHGGNSLSLRPIDLEQANRNYSDPFDAFLCLDKTSAQGGAARYLADYKRMLEDFLLLFTTTGTAGVASSRWVNNLISMMKQDQGGLNRFNGLGVAQLRYPKSGIEKLSAYRIFKNSFSEDFLRIDKKYKQELADIEKHNSISPHELKKEVPTRQNFFIEQFKHYANSQTVMFDGFYVRCNNDLKLSFTDPDTNKKSSRNKHDICFENIHDFLYKKLIQNITYNHGNLEGEKVYTYLAKEVKEFIDTWEKSEDKPNAVGDIVRLSQQHKQRVEELSLNFFRTAANSIFPFEDVSDNSIASSRANDFSVLRFILGHADKDDQMDPVAIRFFLYALTKKVKEKHRLLYRRDDDGEFKGLLATAQNAIKTFENDLDFFPKTTETREDPATAIVKALESNSKFGGIGGLIHNAVKDFWEGSKEHTGFRTLISNHANSLQQFLEYTVEYQVLDILLTNLERANKIWEKYFINVDAILSLPNNEVEKDMERLYGAKDTMHYQDIFNDSDPKVVMNKKDRFIDHIYSTSGIKDNINGEVTRVLLKETLLKLYDSNQGQAFTVSSIELGAREILNSLHDIIKKTAVFDINVIDALETLMRITNNTRDVGLVLEEEIDALRNASGPFLQTTGDGIKNLCFWELHKRTSEAVSKLNNSSIANQLGVKMDDTGTDKLFDDNSSANSGYMDDNPLITPYEIVCMSISSNLSYTNIVPFVNTAIDTKDETSLNSIFSSPKEGGHYFNAYYINKLRNWITGEASVHIDDRWGGLNVLVDMNKGIDDLLDKEVKKAFIRGLSMGWISSKLNNLRQKTWKLDTNVIEDTTGKEGFMFTKGKAAEGNFIGLLNALYDNMHIVLAINGYMTIDKQVKGSFWDTFEADQRKLGSSPWYKLSFINNCKADIKYLYHPRTKYTILDIIFSLHQEGVYNSQTFALQNELLKILLDELVGLHKKYYGEAGKLTTHLRNVINSLLDASRLAADKQLHDCDLRQTWFDIINEYYELESSLKQHFKLCKNK